MENEAPASTRSKDSCSTPGCLEKLLWKAFDIFYFVLFNGIIYSSKWG
ncbi:MAG: hypothetical protein JXB33_08205 [Clostridia bacterium]|nr:hypothetical protein [Clostridia bacterium]